MTLFAFFGIGPMEIVVLIFIVLVIVAVVVGVVLIVRTSSRPKLPPQNYVDSLERENDELREEIERLKRRQDADS